MPWGEAIRHTHTLCADPSSRVAAALQGWEYPVSLEWLALKALHDKFAAANFKKPHPVLPAPWDEKPTRWGKAMPLERFREVLARHRAAAAADEVAQVRGG